MSESICVGVRLRPFVGYEAGQAQVLEVDGNTVTVIAEVAGREAKTFAFDAVMDSTQPTSPNFAGQLRCYELMAQRMVEHVLTGFNTCLFCYGQTGTGKTTTIMGAPSPVEDQGLLLRLLSDLFEKGEQFNAEGSKVRFKVQMLEVYNEKIKDLLAHGIAGTYPDVHVHPRLGVYIKGVNEEVATSFDDCLKLIEYGNTMKTVAATAMNEKSSRGHTIFKLMMEKTGGSDNMAIMSEVFFVDLAGRENEKTTKATGDRFAELSFINRSLMWLANCIQKLGDDAKQEVNARRRTLKPKLGDDTKQEVNARRRTLNSLTGESDAVKRSFAPKSSWTDMSRFRNSKLTLLLSNALSGNSKTSMIGTLSPALDNFEESFSTLNFASTVKSIKVEATAAVAVDKDSLVASLQEELAQLKKQLELSRQSEELDQTEDIAKQVEATDSLYEKYRVHWHEAQLATSVQMEKRQEAMAKLGITGWRQGVYEPDVPHLTNYSDDPYLSGRIVLYPPDSDCEFSVGFDETCKFVVPRSLGLSPKTCVLRRDSASRLWISAVEEGDGEIAYVEVNRTRIGVGATELKHHDCVVLGRSQIFYAFTRQDGGIKNLPAAKQRSRPATVGASVGEGEESSDELLRAILSQRLADADQLRLAHQYYKQLQAQNLNSDGSALLEDFLFAARTAGRLVEEANEITEQVRSESGIRFELATTAPVLGYGFGRACLPELSVRVVQDVPREMSAQRCCSDSRRRKTVVGILQKLEKIATDGGAHSTVVLFVWSFEKFTTRLQLMHDVYDEWAADPGDFKIDPCNDAWSEFGPGELQELRQENNDKLRKSLCEVRMLRQRQSLQASASELSVREEPACGSSGGEKPASAFRRPVTGEVPLVQGSAMQSQLNWTNKNHLDHGQRVAKHVSIRDKPDLDLQRSADISPSRKDVVPPSSSPPGDLLSDNVLFGELKRLCECLDKMQLDHAELVAELQSTRAKLNAKQYEIDALEIAFASGAARAVNGETRQRESRSSSPDRKSSDYSASLLELCKANMGLILGLYNTFSRLGIAMLHASSACLCTSPAGSSHLRGEQHRLADATKHLAEFFTNASPLMDWVSKSVGPATSISAPCFLRPTPRSPKDWRSDRRVVYSAQAPPGGPSYLPAAGYMPPTRSQQPVSRSLLAPATPTGHHTASYTYAQSGNAPVVARTLVTPIMTPRSLT